MDEITRSILQDSYISRLIEGMDISDLCQYAYDKLDEELDELHDDELMEQVAEYYPDLLTE
jgi:predicted house-cleaning noncanonical NTP pyrophosphatase (MazG superfamily)